MLTELEMEMTRKEMDRRKKEVIRRTDVTHPIIKELTSIRRRRKLTQSKIATKMSTTASAIARLESGGGKKQHSPSLRTLEAYAMSLNCKIEMKVIQL